MNTRTSTEAGTSEQGLDTTLAAAQTWRFEAVLEQLEHLRWDAAALARHRSRELAETLAFAAQRSAWHADRLADVDLDKVTPDDLTSLPTMTKAELMADWDRVVTDPRLSLDLARAHLDRLDREGPSLLLGEYFVFTTGGSTGEPGVFPWSTHEFARWGASNVRFGADAGDPAPERLTFVSARSLRHASAWAPLLVYGAEAGGRLLVPVDQPVSVIIDTLNTLDPDSLWAVSSMLPILADAAATGTLRIAPRRIAVGGDAVDPRALDAAENAFGVRPTETYPTTDVGFVASQPPGEGAMVVNDDLLILESVDENDQPVEPSEVSHHLLITSLHQRTVPIIRYRIDDRVRLAPPGGKYPAYSRIAAIDGRADDLFHYGDLIIHPHTFRTVMTRHAGVRDYQVRQTAGGANVLVHVDESCDLDRLTAELFSALAAAGLPDATVDVNAVDTIPRSRLGKRLFFVSQQAAAPRDVRSPK
jgi:phenylacetate-CoA ligase